MATGRQLFGSLSKPQSLFRQTFFKGLRVLDAASLLRHGTAPFRERKAGAQPAFSTPIIAKGLCGGTHTVRRYSGNSESYLSTSNGNFSRMAQTTQVVQSNYEASILNLRQRGLRKNRARLLVASPTSP